MSPPKLHYWTSDGLPPNGSRASGAPPGYSAPSAPPPYTAHRHVGYMVGPPLSMLYGLPVVTPSPPPLSPSPAAFVLAPVFLLQALPSILDSPSRSATPPSAKVPGAATEFTDGMTGLILPKLTLIHFMANSHQPWHNPESEFNFTAHRVPISTTVKELIEGLGVPGTSDSERGIVECHEVRNGTWVKGSVFKLNEDKSDQQLKDLGWNETRGTSKKPVWLAVYQE